MATHNDNAASSARPARRRLANAIRMLSMDAVEAARSGHPGTSEDRSSNSES